MYGSNEDNLQPIPLTEEWLVKFGFEKDKDNEVFCDCSEGWLCIYNNGIYDVHQLQNLYFALTNEELKITE